MRQDDRPEDSETSRPGYRADLETAEGRRQSERGWIIAASVLIAIFVIAGAGLGVWRYLFQGIPATPEVESLWALNREPSVEVLASDGTLIGQRGPFYGRRVEVEDLPEHLTAAFLAAEDRRFFQHHGVDFRAIVRAAIANWRAGETVQGGSTITQQLVKNLVLVPDRTIRRKAQEVRLSLALERRMSKDEILALYLNRIYLGERAFGVEAASQRYFGKSARDATLSESALLAALPKAPSRLSPQDNLAAARERAELVLNRMVEFGFIAPERAQEAIATPAELIATPDAPPPPGMGYAFDEAVRQARRIAPDAPDLVIRTTLDPGLQAMGETALTSVMSRNSESAHAGQAALVALDYSGAIRVMVGGRDYQESQFNRATQAMRQPGSAFKAMVYAAAFELGMRPATIRTDQKLTIGDWEPENFGGRFRGRVTLEDAFARSINTVAAKLGQDVGPLTVAEMARRFGVQTELAAHPSIALGASELTLLELTGAYSVFARDGGRIDPFLIAQISDTSGRIIYERPDVQPAQVYSARLAQMMTGMMRSVVTRGTGTRAALDGRPAAGKTGTSQDYRDALFVGYTGNFITGVWVGNDDDSPMRNITGGNLPAMIWHDFMEDAEAELPVVSLNNPLPASAGRSERLVALYTELAAAFERTAAMN